MDSNEQIQKLRESHPVQEIDLNELTPETLDHLHEILGVDPEDNLLEMIFQAVEFHDAVDFQDINDGNVCDDILKLDILDDSLAQLDGDADSNFSVFALLPSNVAVKLSCQIRQGCSTEVYNIEAYPGDQYEELVRYEKVIHIIKKMSVLLLQSGKGSTPITFEEAKSAFEMTIGCSPRLSSERDASHMLDNLAREPAEHASSKIRRSF